MNKVDIVISGAGMVGAITGLTLAQAGYSVCLIDQAPQSEFDEQSPLNLRVSAIAQKNLKVLDELGVMQHMIHDRLGYYQHMSVWDNRSTGSLDFDQVGGSNLGAIIENQHITAATQSVLLNEKNAQCIFQSKINDWYQSPRKVSVTLDDGRQIDSKILLVAEGANSAIRTEAGIITRVKDYQQQGLVCHIRLSDAPESTALQAFNQSGPVGILPMNKGIFSIVWTLPDDQVDHWLSVDESKFISGLKIHINRHFGDMELISDRVAFPLKQMYANEYFKERMVLIGDAAHTIHPLAGQGVNLGIADGQCLKHMIDSVNLNNSDDLLAVLKKYQRKRKAEVFKTSEMMSMLNKMFNSEMKSFGWVRGHGMNLLNKMGPIKNWLIEQAGS